MSGGGGCMEGLNDDVLDSILVRLPSLSVLRCRVVCKTWHRITTDRSFLAAHAARRPREMILKAKQSRLLSTIPLSVDDDVDPMAQRRFLCNLWPRGAESIQCSLLFSVDGLLVLQERIGLYIICNPVTRQWTYLPALGPARPACYAFPAGFYHHRSSGEYRLLCSGIGEDELSEVGADFDVWDGTSTLYYYILSTAAVENRRRLAGRVPPRPQLDHTIQCWDPVLYRGVLHWFSEHPEGTATGKMLAFDTVSETFRLMPRPPERAGAGEKRTLLVLDGELSVTALHGITSLDIWVLQDYEESPWVLRHRVELPPPRLPKLMTVDRALPVGSGAILIGGMYIFDRVLRLYLINDKRVHAEIYMPGTTIATFMEFSESLVHHAFFFGTPLDDDEPLPPISFSDPEPLSIHRPVDLSTLHLIGRPYLTPSGVLIDG